MLNISIYGANKSSRVNHGGVTLNTFWKGISSVSRRTTKKEKFKPTAALKEGIHEFFISLA